MNKLTFLSDPSHGWLLVPVKMLALVGMTPASFSRFSYRKGDTVALEEDCDAPRFMDAWQQQHPDTPVEFFEVTRELPAYVRGWPRANGPDHVVGQ